MEVFWRIVYIFLDFLATVFKNIMLKNSWNTCYVISFEYLFVYGVKKIIMKWEEHSSLKFVVVVIVVGNLGTNFSCIKYVQ